MCFRLIPKVSLYLSTNEMAGNTNCISFRTILFVHALDTTEIIDLDTNIISGIIPTEIGRMTGLSEFQQINTAERMWLVLVSFQYRSVWRYGSCLVLLWHVLNHCFLDDISKTTPERWSCSDNFLDDTIPTQVGNLKSLGESMLEVLEFLVYRNHLCTV